MRGNIPRRRLYAVACRLSRLVFCSADDTCGHSSLLPGPRVGSGSRHTWQRESGPPPASLAFIDIWKRVENPPMTRRTLKSFGPVTLIDTRIWDNRYLVTGPSGDRSFDDMASAETYFVNESLKDLDRGAAEPAAPE